uniref:Putative methyltransferase n=1 Tax=viral metagenome TaxID=1070528 RepID=A0A6H1ZGT7_9ZZZZ
MIPRNRVALLKTLPRHSVGLEVGVYRANFSLHMIRHVRPRILYLVDAWRRMPNTNKHYTDDWHHTNLFIATCRMLPYIASGVVRPLCVVSGDAPGYIPDKSLDWVYIDADHTYEGCKSDFARWWPKVKFGGTVMAHDYSPADFPGVVKAIDEFEAKNGIKRVGRTEEVHPTVWFKKEAHLKG